MLLANLFVVIMSRYPLGITQEFSHLFHRPPPSPIEAEMEFSQPS